MKQLLAMLAALALTPAVYAQLNKGAWMLGGSAGFNYGSNKFNDAMVASTTKTTVVMAQPSVGYFVISGLAVGLQPGISTSSTRYNSRINYGAGVNNSYVLANATSKSTQLSIAPFVRYYILPVKNKVNIIAEASYTYAHAKSSDNATTFSFDNNGLPVSQQNVRTSKYNFHAYGIAAGPAFFLNPKVSLQLLVGYSRVGSKNGDYAPLSQDVLALQAGFQIHLGK